MAILAALAVALAVALPGVSADGGGDNNEEAAQTEEQALPIPEKAVLTYPNLGSHLDQLVTSVETGQATAQDAASNSSVHSGGSVAVTIYLTDNADAVVSFLEDNGGDPRNVGEDYIEAYVPVTLLGPVSEQPGVIRVREIVPPEPNYGPITSQGVQTHLVQPWHDAGYSGQGVKVGVIDLGFEGFSGLLGTELPAKVQARCYTDLGRFSENLADCETGEADDDHGTIVAESLIDIAPQVDLYIGHPVSRGDLQAIAEWMTSQGVSVINHSVGWPLDGPGDGTSPFSRSPLNTVERTMDGGAVWVNSAGNDALETWYGSYTNSDRDQWVDFNAIGGEGNYIRLPANDEVESFAVELRWEDSWGGATSDLDLFLFDEYTNELVASVRDLQSGASGHYPYEYLRLQAAPSPDPIVGRYYVAVSHELGDAPEWIQLRIRFFGELQDPTRNGSIGNPAESANPGMLTVGAAHWDDVRAIEPYSSRGPTPDGRVKPDIVGADCGATALRPLNEYNEGFCGTSQAAPHVAGLAALVRQRFSDYTPEQVADYLKNHAQQRETPDPNNTWGHGFAQLPPPDGTVPPVPPPSNAFTRDPAADFNTLADAGNILPGGIWSDGTTMWVSDWLNDKIYAYDLATKARIPSRDFNTLIAAGNQTPGGIWSDGTTMWVSDWFLGDKIYAYDLATKARIPSRDFNTLIAAGNQTPEGIWSDGMTMWVSDWSDDKVYAYDMATKARVPAGDFDTLIAARNTSPEGIWSDGLTMWVVDADHQKIYAYDMATKARVLDREFNTLDGAGNWRPGGIWSDGTTMWVSDSQDDKIYAYRMPKVVVFGSPNWPSVQLQTEIARYVIEHGYGYATEEVPGDRMSLLQGLRNGDIVNFQND